MTPAGQDLGFTSPPKDETYTWQDNMSPLIEYMANYGCNNNLSGLNKPPQSSLS